MRPSIKMYAAVDCTLHMSFKILVMARHTIRPVSAGTIPVLRLCPGQSAKKSRLRIQSASIVLDLLHQLSLREVVLS